MRFLFISHSLGHANFSDRSDQFMLPMLLQAWPTHGCCVELPLRLFNELSLTTILKKMLIKDWHSVHSWRFFPMCKKNKNSSCGADLMLPWKMGRVCIFQKLCPRRNRVFEGATKTKSTFFVKRNLIHSRASNLRVLHLKKQDVRRTRIVCAMKALSVSLVKRNALLNVKQAGW